jgi:hypothetical protein
MAAHVTVASVHDFKLFSYFFALFLIFLDIDACDFKSFDFYLSHFIHAFCLFTSIYNVLLIGSLAKIKSRIIADKKG